VPQVPPLGEFEQVILLALVRLGADAYGVTIHQEIARRTGRDVSLAAVYTTLDRLERKGYVSHWMGTPTSERGGRRKKHYRIEPAGAAALTAALDALGRMTAGLGRRLANLRRQV
jgi:PadR family transcriptional regulator, regulatory protein PadR